MGETAVDTSLERLTLEIAETFIPKAEGDGLPIVVQLILDTDYSVLLLCALTLYRKHLRVDITEVLVTFYFYPYEDNGCDRSPLSVWGTLQQYFSPYSDIAAMNLAPLPPRLCYASET